MFITDLIEEPLRGITLLYGAAATGKTTACLQALHGRSVYVSTNRNFNVERLRTMRPDAAALLARLALFEPGTLEELEKAVVAAAQLGAVSDLIVVDSIATYVRTSERKLANLALHRMLERLRRAACPVLLTSEVYERAEGAGTAVFVGGDMLRLASGTIIELGDGLATVRKHPVHAGRHWRYRIADGGLARDEKV